MRGAVPAAVFPCCCEFLFLVSAVLADGVVPDLALAVPLGWA